MINASEQQQKHELSAVKPWLSIMAERGVIPANSARLRATAVEQLSTVLGPEEPRDVAAVLAGLEDITRRWATKTMANPETAATYQQRARRALQDFIDFQADPTGFRPKAPKVVRLVQEGEKAAKRVPKQAELIPAPKAPEQPAATQAEQKSPERGFPLSDGEEFYYRLPRRGLTVKEVRKIVWHLLATTSDWDGASHPFREDRAPERDIAKKDD